jgi:outer membrane receptor protein involved in Fe transport
LHLLGRDSALVQRTATDSTGIFTLQAARGQYRLIVEQFGREFLNKEIILDKDTNMGLITINETAELQGVTVAARKKLVEQKVDRLVFHVENATAVTGGTALDALKATPTVRVQNETISIVGKGEVLVMVDDRLQRMSQEDLTAFLRSIPADNIKSIEVITAPPAKYDAEGNSGLINIRLKTARKNSWNANIGASYTQRTYASGNLQGLFNYNRNRLSLQASVNKSKDKLLTTTDGNIFYPGETWNQAIRNKSETDVLGVGLGIDYQWSKRWTSGLKYMGSFTDKAAANDPLTTRFNHSTQAADGYIAAGIRANNKPGIHTVNWYHAIKLDSTGKQLTVDMDYFSYRKKDQLFFEGNELDKNKVVLPNTFFSSSNSNMNRIQNYSGKLDLSLPYKWANISFGGKVSYTNTNNDLVVYDYETGAPVLNTNQSNLFNYKEYNEALYFSANKKLDARWETQLGLRMEATQTEGYSKNLDQLNKNKYIRLFPTAYVTYVPDQENSFSLNYSRRIRRPDFDYLNPFLIRTSPYFYSEGNPFLKPSYIDNLEFSYTRNQQWVSAVYYSQVTDFGQELSIVDPVSNITRQTPVNYANTYQLGLSTYYHFNKWSRWSSVSGFNMNYQHVQSKTGFIASVDGFNGYLYTNNDFTLDKAKTIFFGLNYAVQLPGRYQIFHISNMHMLDLSMKFLLWDKKLSLTVAGQDLLNAQRPLISYYSNGIKNTVRSYGDTRGFRVSISYKFGNKDIKARQRNAGNEDERNRTNL